jgi:hypothetical protein
MIEFIQKLFYALRIIIMEINKMTDLVMERVPPMLVFCVEHYWTIPILVVCIAVLLFAIEVIRNRKLTMKYKGHYIGGYSCKKAEESVFDNDAFSPRSWSIFDDSFYVDPMYSHLRGNVFYYDGKIRLDFITC